MLALLTDPAKTSLVDSVNAAAASLQPPLDVKLIDFSFANRPTLEEVPLFGRDIATSTASVIDADIRPLTHMHARVSSVAGYLLRELEGTDDSYAILHSLDRRMLFVTARKIEKCEVYRHFGRLYSFISTKGRKQEEATGLVADWLREMHGKDAPRIFVSYRSTRKADAERTATLLRSRGAHVWFDDLSIPFGASITEEVNRGLGWCTHFVLLVDEEFFDSKWATTEFESIMYRRLSPGRYHEPLPPILLPLFFVDPNHEKVPPMLRVIKGVDMRNTSLEDAIDKIWPALVVIGSR